MRIAFLLGMFPKLSETFVLNQITGLIDRGHEVSIFAMSKAESEYHDDVARYNLLERTHCPEPVPPGLLPRFTKSLTEWKSWAGSSPVKGLGSLVLSFPLNSRGVTRLMLAKLLRVRAFDIMHCHFGFMGAVAAKMIGLRLLNYPFVTSYHGSDLSGVQPNDYKQLHQRGALFTVNSEFSRKRVIELGCPEDRIALLPVGVNVDYFPVSERKLGPDGILRILSVARLVEAKGIGTALEAIHLLHKKGLRIRYDIVGDGPIRRKLERQVAEAELQHVVIFHGSLIHRKVRERLNEAHIFVLPSIPSNTGLETQGLVLQEAQSTGLPVVASNYAGIPEGLEEGKSGYLFPPGDSRALAERIEWLANNHLAWPEMGRAGRRLVEAKYNIDCLNDKLVNLYANVRDKHHYSSNS